MHRRVEKSKYTVDYDEVVAYIGDDELDPDACQQGIMALMKDRGKGGGVKGGRVGSGSGKGKYSNLAVDPKGNPKGTGKGKGKDKGNGKGKGNDDGKGKSKCRTQFPAARKPNCCFCVIRRVRN